MAVSFQPRLRMRPSTTTVSTFDGCAAVTSMCAGSPNMPRLTSRVDTMMRSARLPALSEPTLSAIPIECAPSIVPSSSTRRAVSLNSFTVLDVLNELHDAEHVGITGKLHRADRQSDRNVRRQHVRSLRQAEADAQLTGG